MECRYWLVVVCALGAASCAPAKEGVELKTHEDRLSYAIGTDFGATLKRQGVDIDLNIFTQGVKDGADGKELLLTPEEMKETMLKFQSELQKKQASITSERAEKNKKEGEAFLPKNKEKEGVITLSSGLQYSVLKEGDGEKPSETDTVTVHYTGTLIDGTVFDSSHKRGEPTTFHVNGVISGWQEGLQLMKVGATWKFFIPSELAYGTRGASALIGPNATLIFEVELISIN
ncbi:MAG: hypothetical protein GKR87_06110 [Kiritimatiellae bacterium]|nr:hypothetical protein [Kiritimatiellia bacterium]